jgi:spore germination protein YaaH
LRNRVAGFSAVLFVLASQAFAAFKTSVWVPPWSANALTSMQTYGRGVDESNPVWYAWNADYSIAKGWNAENPTWRASMGGAIVPTIQNLINDSFNGDAAAAMLANPTAREAHATAIAGLVLANGFDGIDIDYERVPTSARANFTAFIGSLATKLHAMNKKLSVTVYAKASDKENWNGPGSQDWPAIGATADSVKIMSYDYHWSTSGPGAIAPLTWLDQVAAYAEQTIAGSKIMMGLPWYGYDWPASGAASNASYAYAQQTALTNNAKIQYDADSGEPFFSYSGHTVYFQDATGYAAKVNLLKQKHPGIGGFAHWAAGQEDPNIWKVISGSSSSGGTPVQTDFTLSGPTTMQITQGSSASADFRLIAVNGFTGTASVTTQLAFAGSAFPSSATVTAGSTVGISVTPTAAPGTYTMTVRFTSGTLVHEQLVSVTVLANTKAKHRAVK